MKINKDRINAVLCIVFILAVIFICILTVSGCTTTRYVPLKDTITEVRQIEHHDTIKINQRSVDVNVPLPAVKYVNATKDTTSTLSDGLYKSLAYIKGGILYHSLFTVPDAHLKAKVSVQDTTKTSNSKIADNKTSKISVPYPVYKNKYIVKPLSWWQKTIMKIGYIGLLAIIIAAGYGCVKLYKKFNIASIISKIIK